MRKSPLLPGFLLLLGGLWLSQPLQASSYREQQLSQALRAENKIGQAVDMTLDDNSQFLAFYTKADTPKSRGCVILLHGLDGHLDWPQIIGPLRRQLPRYGWNTLSIQLATLGNFHRPKDYQALYRDTSKRLGAALAFLEKRGIFNIVLLGHSLGGSMGLYHLGSMSDNFNKSIIAFIGIGMYDPDNIASEFTSANAVAHLKIPVLDIYGELDSLKVIHAVAARKIAAAKAGKKNLQQVPFSGGDHFLTGQEARLQKRVRLWANKQAPSMEVEKKPKSP